MVETDGVAEAEIVIDCAAVEAEPDVKIQLLRSGETPRAAAVDKLGRPLMVVVADILGEQIGRRAEIPFKGKCRLNGRVSHEFARIPGHGEHAGEYPVIRDSMRPGKLYVGLVSRPRDVAGA